MTIPHGRCACELVAQHYGYGMAIYGGWDVDPDTIRVPNKFSSGFVAVSIVRLYVACPTAVVLCVARRDGALPRDGPDRAPACAAINADTCAARSKIAC